MVKRTTQQEKGLIVNIYTQNIRAPKFLKQTLLYIKDQININTILVSGRYQCKTFTKRLTEQKINKELSELNHAFKQID